jgi:uncharacterized protein (DUF1015 family)
VPDFTPFAGVRYDTGSAGVELDALVAPPYDVIDDDLHAALEAASARNSVRLILPRDRERDGDRYEQAASTFARWCNEGVLVRDAAPRFYGYRMDFTDRHGRRRHTQGAIGALALPDAGDNSVLPHERTLPKAKSDRLALLEATRANFDPIWGLSLASGLTARLGNATPLSTCTDGDGNLHTLTAVDNADEIAAIRALVGGAPVVLADGHHRFETACNYRNALRDAGDDAGGGAAIMTFVVELVDDELCIEPIHRMLDLPDDVDVRARLADTFEVEDAGANTPEGIDALELAMDRRASLGLVDRRGLALLIPRDGGAETALADEHPAVATTDAAVVEALIVPRLPEASWQYRHDAHAIAALVDKHAVSAAILCRPVSVAQTRSAAQARVRMPQKTTFFWPKPRTGMVFRTLE